MVLQQCGLQETWTISDATFNNVLFLIVYHTQNTFTVYTSILVIHIDIVFCNKLQSCMTELVTAVSVVDHSSFT